MTCPVMWANLIAWPAAGYVMHRWLQDFAYHIDLQVWMSAASAMIAVAVAMATVMGHALRVARAQPVTALRHE